MTGLSLGAALGLAEGPAAWRSGQRGPAARGEQAGERKRCRRGRGNDADLSLERGPRDVHRFPYLSDALRAHMQPHLRCSGPARLTGAEGVIFTGQ
jgi:hypothetical protein